MSSWEEKTFEDVCNVDIECLPANTSGNYEFIYISLSDVDTGKLLPTIRKTNFRQAPSRARRIVHSKDILMATVRPNLKAFTYINKVNTPKIASTGFAVLSKKDNYSTLYIYHYLFSEHITR